MPNEQVPAPMAPSTRSNLYLPISIIVAGALVGTGLFFGLASSNTGAGAGGPQQQLITSKSDMQKLVQKNRAPAQMDLANAKPGGDIFIGNANAPVTMTYWFDYQCPFCKQFEATVLPTLVDKYVNAGKLKIVFKDYSFLGQDSITDAEYAHAIWDLYPDKFYQWHSAMYDVQDSEGDVGFGNAQTVDTLISLVGGIDDGKVKAQIQKNKSQYDTAIAAEQKSGADLGVQGTPGFKIGKQMIDGAQPLNVFQQALDALLK